MKGFSCYVFFIISALLLVRLNAYKLTLEIDGDDSLDSPKDTTDVQAVLRQLLTSPGNLESGKCNCAGLECGCCAMLNLWKIKGPVCVNATYLPKDIGLRIEVTYNDVVLFDTTLSVKNPRPLCFGVPFTANLVSICIALHDLDFSNHRLSGCFRLDVKLVTFVQKIELGCFHIPYPLGSQDSKDIREFEALLKGMEVQDQSQSEHLKLTGEPDESEELQEMMTSFYDYLSTNVKDSKCQCKNFNCGCCIRSNIKFLSGNVCFNVSYVSEQQIVNLVATVQSQVILRIAVTAQKMPPACTSVQSVNSMGSLCFDVYNLNYANSSFNGCAKMEVKLAFFIHKTFDFGCFHLPLAEAHENQHANEMAEDVQMEKIYKRMLLQMYNNAGQLL